MKNKVDKVNVDELVPVSVDLSKLSDAVKNDVVKKDIYIMLRLKILKKKYLILLTELLIPLLVLKVKGLMIEVKG